MNKPVSRPSRGRRLVLVMPLIVASLFPTPARAQTADAPDSFSVSAAGTGMLVELSAPAALPLDVVAGIAYAQVGVNSQPRVQSTAAPVFVPLFDSLGLLGGTSGVLSVVVRTVPGLVVGAPSLIGLDPIPVDPSLVPAGPLADAVADQPLPDPPQLGCTSQYPDEPQSAECGGGAQDFFGFRVGAASARTTSSGNGTEPASLVSRSDASAAGITPGASFPIAPVTAGSVVATSESKIIDGRITAVSSAGASDLDIAGLLSIESVRASFSGALGATAETLGESFECNISGVRSGGQEIEIGTDVITLNGDDTAVGGLEDLVTGLLEGVGGDVGEADLGSITVTPNPEPITEISADGTSLERRFGCLEVRYRNITSGSDVTLTFGNVAVSMTAFNDEPFSAAPVDGTDVATPTPTLDQAGSSAGSPSGAGDSVDTGGVEQALPEVPEAGSSAPRPAADAFLETSSIAGWGIDGLWLAPFSLLALSIPFLVKSRRLTFSTDRS